MTKENYIEYGKGMLLGLIFCVGLGLIFDYLLIGAIAGLVLGGAVGYIMNRRLESI